jgi:hypothetical protein
MRVETCLKAGFVIYIVGALGWSLMQPPRARTPEQAAHKVAREAERTCGPLVRPDLRDACWAYFERQLVAAVPALREAERKAIDDILVREICPQLGPHAEHCATALRRR